MDPAGRERLYHLLQTAAHRLKARADRESEATVGVSAAQAAVLFVIAQEPGVAQRRVAEQLMLNESAVTAMVGRLIERNLVTRTSSPDDGRAWRLGLTAKGEAALGRFRTHLDRINRDLTDALGGDLAVTGLAEGLRAILAMPDGRSGGPEAKSGRPGRARPKAKP